MVNEPEETTLTNCKLGRNNIYKGNECNLFLHARLNKVTSFPSYIFAYIETGALFKYALVKHATLLKKTYCMDNDVRFFKLFSQFLWKCTLSVFIQCTNPYSFSSYVLALFDNAFLQMSEKKRIKDALAWTCKTPLSA